MSMDIAQQQALIQMSSDPYKYRCRYRQREGFTASTVPGLFVQRCQKTPYWVAIKFKDRGKWRSVTWQEYYQHVEAFGLGLVELGLEPSDRLAAMSPPRPEWFYLDMAGQGVGATVYGIYFTNSPAQVQYVMEKGGARFFVAADKGVTDKILAVADQLPDLKKIIVMDAQGM